MMERKDATRMRKYNKKKVIKKQIIAVLALTLMFTITGCKNIGTIDGKTGTPVTETDVNESVTNVGDTDASKEGLSSSINDEDDSKLAPVYVSLDKDIYSDNDKVIKYTIFNNTDKTKDVVLAPRLEKEVGEEWVWVETNAGFCGTPDSLEEKIDGEIDLGWYPTISDGVYRLSFDLQDKGTTTQISAIFSFKEEVNTSTSTTEEEDTTDWEPTNYNTVNNFNDVTMSIKKDTISEDGLTVVIQNNSDKIALYGEEFVLEKKINEGWYEVPVTIEGDYGFNSIGYEVPSGEEGEWKVDWNWLFGSLNEGEYRIIKNILDFRDAGDFDTYYLSAEFTLNN